MNSSKAQDVLLIAKEMAHHAKSAVDFHNAFFGVAGKFSELFPTRDERERFAKTPEYGEILRLRGFGPTRKSGVMSEPVLFRRRGVLVR